MKTDIILAIFGSTGLFSLIQLIINLIVTRADKKKENQTAQKALLVAIAHDRIIFLCKEPLRRGNITAEEIDNINTIGSAYLEAGGNHLAKKYLEDVSKLPIEA